MNNAPPTFLLKCLEPNTRFVLAHAGMLPRLELREWSAEACGEGIYRLRALLVNSGYLPTYISRRAQEIKSVRPISVHLDISAGAALLVGEATQEIGQLEGRSNGGSLWTRSQPTSNLRKLEWIVRAPTGSTISIRVVAQRAGTLERDVIL